MGIIMMVGIVVSNGVLLVEYTNELRRRGLALGEAVVRAGRTRLRPILMTSLATVFGLLPMALGWLVGGEANAPLARAVIGGLLVSTGLTLVLIPTLYTMLEERFPRHLAPERRARREPPARPRRVPDCRPSTRETSEPMRTRSRRAAPGVGLALALGLTAPVSAWAQTTTTPPAPVTPRPP